MSLPNLSVKSAFKRLLLTYLSIIMALSIGFSAVFYIQSVHEASGNLRSQQQQLRDYLYFTTPEGVQKIQDQQLYLFKKNLFRRLIALNLGMLALGTTVSYFLARRSLMPLAEALESQSRFTSDAAHELRTPLTAMKTEIEVSLRDKNLKLAEAKEVLSSNLEEISKLQTLTDALLRLAKSGDNVDKSHWETFRLADVLESASSRLEDKAQARKINVLLPKSKLNVYGDPGQLVELFATILGNAIKYSHPSSEVRVKAKKQDNNVVVDVIDQGIGIAEVDLLHIFDRFYRADQSRNKTSAEGYGLGLSLAQSIVDAHNGKISVKSVYGKGSTFTVTLPAN